MTSTVMEVLSHEQLVDLSKRLDAGLTNVPSPLNKNERLSANYLFLSNLQKEARGGNDRALWSLGIAEKAADLLDACKRTKEILDSWGPERRGDTLERLHERLSSLIQQQ